MMVWRTHKDNLNLELSFHFVVRSRHKEPLCHLERESSRELIIVKAVSAKGSNRAEERRREEGDTDLELLLPCAALWKRGLWVLRVDGEDDGADHLLGALLEDLHVEFGVACVVRDLAARPSGSFPAAAAATRKERRGEKSEERGRDAHYSLERGQFSSIESCSLLTPISDTKALQCRSSSATVKSVDLRTLTDNFPIRKNNQMNL